MDYYTKRSRGMVFLFHQFTDFTHSSKQSITFFLPTNRTCIRLQYRALCFEYRVSYSAVSSIVYQSIMFWSNLSGRLCWRLWIFRPAPLRSARKKIPPTLSQPSPFPSAPISTVFNSQSADGEGTIFKIWLKNDAPKKKTFQKSLMGLF